MMTEVVFCRTDAGETELIAARSFLTVDQRNVLFLIDGKKKVAECVNEKQIDLILTLLKNNLIRPLYTASSIADSRMAERAYVFLLAVADQLKNDKGIELPRPLEPYHNLSYYRKIASEISQQLKKSYGKEKQQTFILEARSLFRKIPLNTAPTLW